MQETTPETSITFTYSDNIDDAFAIRKSVFLDEQGFSTEFEELDHHPDMMHVVAYDNGKPVGCFRLFRSELEQGLEPLDGVGAEPYKWILGRIAVLPEARKSGLGSLLVREAERLAIERGATEMHLHAQCRAMHFYHKCGYTEYGPYADDEGVPHQWMWRALA